MAKLTTSPFDHLAPLLSHKDEVIDRPKTAGLPNTKSRLDVTAESSVSALNSESKLHAKSRLRRFRGGWRTSVSWGIAGIIAVLIVNVTILAWLYSESLVTGSTVVVHEGSCAQTTKVSTWCHLAINLLSTLMLGASNFGMQCLSAPTRSEIDTVHRKHSCLDIGLPNLRNLLGICRPRLIIWLLLAMSSVSLHLL